MLQISSNSIRLFLLMLFLLNLACNSEQKNSGKKSNESENSTAFIAQKTDFDNLFKLEERIVIDGDSIAPLFTVWRPMITDSKIYVTDYTGNYVYIYNRKGELQRKFGGKGSGPGEFKLPYGVAIDARQNLYVNDRQNNRVQIFDSNFDFLKTIYVVGQSDMMFLRDTEQKPNIISIGPTAGKGGVCYIQEVDWAGNIVRKFAYTKKYFVMNSWSAAQDLDGNIYFMNALDNNLEVFDRAGNRLATLRLSSPSMKTLNTEDMERPQNRSVLSEQFRVLRKKEHSRVEEVHVFEKYLFVFLRLLNSGEKNLYYLDIYDLDGNLLYYGMQVSGWLHCVTNKFYFVEMNEDEKYGRLEISEYSFSEPAS